MSNFGEMFLPLPLLSKQKGYGLRIRISSSKISICEDRDFPGGSRAVLQCWQCCVIPIPPLSNTITTDHLWLFNISNRGRVTKETNLNFIQEIEPLKCS